MVDKLSGVIASSMLVCSQVASFVGDWVRGVPAARTAPRLVLFVCDLYASDNRFTRLGVLHFDASDNRRERPHMGRRVSVQEFRDGAVNNTGDWYARGVTIFAKPQNRGLIDLYRLSFDLYHECASSSEAIKDYHSIVSERNTTRVTAQVTKRLHRELRTAFHRFPLQSTGYAQLTRQFRFFFTCGA